MEDTRNNKVNRADRSYNRFDPFSAKLLDLLAYLTKGGLYLCFTADGFCRIREILVYSSGIAGENGTNFTGMIADGKNVIECKMSILVQVVRGMIRYVDAVLFHGGHGPRIHPMRFHAGTEYLHSISSKMTEIAFGDLAATTVSGAEYQDPFHAPKL